MPVMIGEMLEAMAVRPGATYVDGTYGAGHYTAALLGEGAGTVIAIDRDPAAMREAERRAAGEPRLRPVEGRFGDLEGALEALGMRQVEGIVFDLGVSSMQLDQAARGFSMIADGPLDMRMGAAGSTAADLLNQMTERELADLIWRYGEEPAARRIARAVVEDRKIRPWTRTGELASLVARIAGPRSRAGHHPATRTFQALRIAVNDELGELERGLVAAERALAPGGRLVVVAFHSLEDRLVKRFLVERSGWSGGSRHRPGTRPEPPTFRPLGRRPVRPGAAETARNPRSRSARLRAAERLAGSGGAA